MRKLSVLVRVLGHTKVENAFEVAVSGPEHFCEFDGADLSNGVNHCFERDGLEAHATVFLDQFSSPLHANDASPHLRLGEGRSRLYGPDVQRDKLSYFSRAC